MMSTKRIALCSALSLALFSGAPSVAQRGLARGPVAKPQQGDFSNFGVPQMITHVVNIPSMVTAWSSSATIPLFDPSLGVLQSVEFRLAANINGSAGFENLQPVPATGSVTWSGQIEVFRPDTTSILQVNPSQAQSQNVPAFDGTIDFSGSGAFFSPLTASDMTSSVATPPNPDLLLFTGVGNIVLPVTALGTSTCSGGGNLVCTFAQSADAMVTVIYTYRPDCNFNGIPDLDDIAANPMLDLATGGLNPTCVPNGIIDTCEDLADCNTNGIPDVCDLFNGSSMDVATGGKSPVCTPNGIPDECEGLLDCNNNSIPDVCDVVGTDCNSNGIPDDCEPDCDGDNIPDDCELLGNDCNNNQIPDNCEIPPDCNNNGLPDDCDPDCDNDGLPDDCENEPDCQPNGIPDNCELVGNDCNSNGVPDECDPDCDNDGIPDQCELAGNDCNNNQIPDNCEIPPDCNNNGLPDDCDPDCDNDGLPDDCENEPDCNNNNIPDNCELVGNDCNNNGVPDECDPDCDNDGLPDACENERDCQPNGIPDNCELLGNDCDNNGVPDECDPDCDNDRRPDACELGNNDCNNNGFPDNCELVGNDCNFNGVPDECDPDCDNDGLPDDCETDPDCQPNGIPDNCELVGNDCNNNGVPDECDPDCDNDGLPDQCETDPDCQPNGVPDNCENFQDCQPNGIPDECELVGNDCNNNLRPDECDDDCDGDGLPDSCENDPDCQPNGIPDNCETGPDCNFNGIPDECEPDCDGDNIPDECELDPDCNNNQIPDNCELVGNDCNGNFIPDECEDDCDNNGIPDDCDLATGALMDLDGNGVPDICECIKSNRRMPGSLLLFPEYDNRNGDATVFTVTNTDPRNSVMVEWVYINEANCLEFNRQQLLTPNDTFTQFTNLHSPQNSQGYFWTFAKDPSTGAPIVHNFLAGQLLRMSGVDARSYAINAVSFKGVGDQGDFTDIDMDGHRDLNGDEYEQAPDEILIPRFLGQTAQIESELILVNLSGGKAFTTGLRFLIYNDNEQQFSRGLTFQCWDRIKLSQISSMFNNDSLAMFSDHDPNEILGMEDQEAGWFRINGTAAQSFAKVILDPAFYAFLIEANPDGDGAADLPWELCSQDNGTLLPLSLFGDNED